MNEQTIQELITWLEEASLSSYRKANDDETNPATRMTLEGAFLAYQHTLRKVESLL